MAVPLFTTTVTLAEFATGGDPYETAASTSTRTVPAVIGSPSGNATMAGGHREQVDATMILAPGETVSGGTLVTDTTTGRVWRVVWSEQRTGVGLDHTKVGLVTVEGGANG